MNFNKCIKLHTGRVPWSQYIATFVIEQGNYLTLYRPATLNAIGFVMITSGHDIVLCSLRNQTLPSKTLLRKKVVRQSKKSD